MLTNRSIPNCTVIPELTYANVREAADWLTRAFGFTVRLVIADHRIQMNVGSCAVVVVAAPIHPARVLVRVTDIDRHYERALQSGAEIVQPPTTYPFGERQYTARDFAGHAWTFSESVADVDPREWGGAVGDVGNSAGT